MDLELAKIRSMDGIDLEQPHTYAAGAVAKAEAAIAEAEEATKEVLTAEADADAADTFAAAALKH
ncbi:hypothetical protein MTR_5g045945 [Medicago truncatula]|uniref:Uncharacterized protein n=1 Tax=Medicago truncatula TaxID=3880 RepID=A0A072UE39_MEDTR|nr:hypothetical protein MTR_5g045945 [Medicago truncatula]